MCTKLINEMKGFYIIINRINDIKKVGNLWVI